MPGPIPKRSGERRRRNKVLGETSVTMTGPVKPPGMPRHLHPVAKRWYNSLKASGQSEFFEPSDWAAALYVAEAMTKNLEGKRFSGQLFSSVWSAMESLLTTEQARRRARLEVERAIADDAEETDKPTAIDEYRKALSG